MARIGPSRVTRQRGSSGSEPVPARCCRSATPSPTATAARTSHGRDHPTGAGLRRRDDSDPIPRVVVQNSNTIIGTSFFNPETSELDILGLHTYDALALVHQYAHFVEQQIGSLGPLPTIHDGCQTEMLGVNVNNPLSAWMEGFADWFAQAVKLRAPTSAYLVGETGTLSVDDLESPGCLIPYAGIPGNVLEVCVARRALEHQCDGLGVAGI